MSSDPAIPAKHVTYGHLLPLTVVAVQHRPGGDRFLAQDQKGHLWRSARPQDWLNHIRVAGCQVFIRQFNDGDWITCTCDFTLAQAAVVREVPYPGRPSDPHFGR